MLVTHNLLIDLVKRGPQPVVAAVQGEANTRQLAISLFSNSIAWSIPNGATAAVAFMKPDGTRGLYDKLPDGTPATTLSGNTVHAILAPQALTCAGTVLASVVFYDADGDTLATFPFKITVEKNPAADQSLSNNYYTLQNLDQVNQAYNDLSARVKVLEKGGATTTEEQTVNQTVGTSDVVLDSDAPRQTVNLAWDVPGGKVIPAFENYYLANGSANPATINYPRAFNANAYTQFWSNTAGHGNEAAFVNGHEYFQALHYTMDGDSIAVLHTGFTGADSIVPAGTTTIDGGLALTGSGWVYSLQKPTTLGAVTFCISKNGTGTGTVDYVYCIDVTALREAGTISATSVSELAELFGGLELVPGQNFAGETTSGNATLTITRDGSITEIPLGAATANVQGGDVLVMDTGKVTFLMKVIKTVTAEMTKPWYGKKWVAFGDSLTDESINADKKYYRYIEEHTGVTVVVMGVGGTGYYRTYQDGTAYGQRMAQVPADADVITIFGSVNDWHIRNNNVTVGNASDTVEAGTLAGYINECIDVAIAKAPFAQIALVTPMDYHGLPDDTLESIANTIKAVANYRKIKCLDLYHESGFRVDDPTFALQFTTDYSATAETFGHPSNVAHEKLIAPEFMELLKRMFLTA